MNSEQTAASVGTAVGRRGSASKLARIWIGLSRAFGTRHLRRLLPVAALTLVLVLASGFSAPLYDPMTFVVTSNADPGDGICDADCTLREAIQAANLNPGADHIHFNIGGGGPTTIAPGGGFDVITDPVTIDATTQPGYAGTPLVELDGSAVPPNTSGFAIFGGGTTIKGFVINRFPAHGIQIEVAGGNVIQGNYIGTNADGTQPLGNGDDGVSLNATAPNLIGGPAEGQGNLISANGRNGVLVCCPGSDGNVIQGNFIGTDVSGTQPLGNARAGVQVSEGATGTLVGGDSAGEGNLISSNGGNGVFIAAAGTDGNAVVGNRIGVNATITGLLGNGAHGVAVAAGSQNAVGGAAPGDRNVIAGNAFNGVVIDGGATNTDVQGNVITLNGASGVLIRGGSTADNVVQGNLIGVGAAGDIARPNGFHGVEIVAGAHHNLIGGSAPESRNIISANRASGVAMVGPAWGNRVEGNYIGADVSGTAALGNPRAGVEIVGSPANQIGGSAEGAGNVISGNGEWGVMLIGANSSGNTVHGNLIGTDPTGTAAVGGARVDGIVISSAPDNRIGGGQPGERNIISGNDGQGIRIEGTLSTGNVVQGNYIGTDISGEFPLGNGMVGNHAGIVIHLGASSNVIGGSGEGEGNVISANSAAGVALFNAETSHNQLLGNRIGTNAMGDAALPNVGLGVLIAAASHHNAIGGGEEGARNLIAGNVFHGVGIFGEGTVENTVQGNYIGLDGTGTSPLPNNERGVMIAAGASNNLIGGAGAGNVISGNDQDGVVLEGPGTSGNHVQGNRIGTDPTGQEAIGNGGSGIGLFDQASDNLIGGAGSGEGNLISGNGGDGVALDGAGTDGNIVQGNRVGTNVDGTEPLGNGGSGVWVGFGPANTVIGGVDGAGNLISGNGADGVSLNVDSTGSSVQGNRIGSDWSGTDSIPNGGPGITIAGAAGNLIGGTEAGEGNLISGNSGDGLGIFDESAQANIVQGNYIGTDAAGASELPNGASGVLIAGGAHGNTIGGTGVGAGNLISGNLDGDGVALAEDGTTDNHLLQNLIGTNADGDAPLPNGGSGVWIGDGASDNHVGGGEASAGNLISGNGGDGVSLNGLESTGNHVQGNRIGTDAAGENAVANGSLGIFVSAAESVIGGTEPGEGNLISGNSAEGILLVDEATGNTVQGNLIGTDISGLAAVPNHGIGVVMAGEAHHNQIGGDEPGAGNIISGNLDQGLGIFDEGAAENVVQGNFIGTDATGTAAIPNTFSGVLIAGGASDNLIGGPGAGNVLSGNSGSGIVLVGDGTSGNVIQGNYVGTSHTGEDPLPNAGSGVVLVFGAQNNLIGGTEDLAANVISGNLDQGVALVGEGASGNRIQGNFIGTDLTGANPLGNGQDGIVVILDASNNLIGGEESGAGNVIAYNGGAGVELRESAGTGNTILANSIFSNAELGIDLGADGVTGNDAHDLDEGPNDLQNHPFLTPYLVVGREPRLVGFLQSEPNTEFRIELFANTECDDSGHGEGATFLAATTVVTGRSGFGFFRFELGDGVPVGAFLTSTATNPDGSTSEFSRCVRVIFRGVGH